MTTAELWQRNIGFVSECSRREVQKHTNELIDRIRQITHQEKFVLIGEIEVSVLNVLEKWAHAERWETGKVALTVQATVEMNVNQLHALDVALMKRDQLTVRNNIRNLDESEDHQELVDLHLEAIKLDRQAYEFDLK